MQQYKSTSTKKSGAPKHFTDLTMVV